MAKKDEKQIEYSLSKKIDLSSQIIKNSTEDNVQEKHLKKETENQKQMISFQPTPSIEESRSRLWNLDKKDETKRIDVILFDTESDMMVTD